MRRFDELTDAEKAERLERVAHKALLGYGLSGDLRLLESSTHTVFLLRTGGAAYAVRACAAGRDRPPLERELTWLAALGRDTKLCVPEPLLTLTGDLFRTVSLEGVPGTRACAVLRWVDGERREAELVPEEAAAAGRLAAALHAHSETFRWPEELALLYVQPAVRVLQAADALRGLLTSPDDRARLCDVVSTVDDGTSGLGDDSHDVGIVHGDLRLRKLRHEGGAAGAFGFDECRVGAFLDDLSVLWAELAGRDATSELRNALLDGYRSFRVLPDSCERALRAFSTLRDLESIPSAAPATRAARRVDPAVASRVSAALRQLLAPQS